MFPGHAKGNVEQSDAMWDDWIIPQMHVEEGWKFEEHDSTQLSMQDLKQFQRLGDTINGPIMIIP